MSKDLLINGLETITNSLKSGNSNLTESQCIDALDLITKMNSPSISVSIEEKAPKLYSTTAAVKELNISRATFDRRVDDNTISKGTKVKGINSLIYTQKDIDDAKENIKKRNGK